MSEVNNSPASNKGNWQDAIVPAFQERLMRPLIKPGVIDKAQLAGSILSRSEQFANRLPLVSQLERRFSSVKNLPSSQVPIVYAQPLGGEANTATPKNLPVSGQVSRAIVQAKFASVPSKNANLSPRAIAPTTATSVANSVSVRDSVPSSPLPVVRSQNVESTRGTQNLLANQSSAQANINIDATKAPTSQPIVPSQKTESTQVQQDLITSPSSENVKPISASPRLSVSVSSSSENAIAASKKPPISPLPLVRTQNIEPISTSQKQEPAQSERLPIASAQPSINEVSNLGNSLTLANSQPLQTEANSLPVVQPRYSQNKQITQSQNLPTASPNTSSVPQTTENYSQPTSETKSSIPIVQLTNPVRSWLEPQPHPLLKNQTTANTIPNQTFNRKTEIGATNLGTPLVFSTPTSSTGQGQAANNPDSNWEAGQANNNPATAMTTTSQQITPNFNRPPAVESTQFEGNNTPNNNNPTKIDVDALADKVERKLMRRLVIENERRGQTRWR